MVRNNEASEIILGVGGPFDLEVEQNQLNKLTRVRLSTYVTLDEHDIISGDSVLKSVNEFNKVIERTNIVQDYKSQMNTMAQTIESLQSQIDKNEKLLEAFNTIREHLDNQDYEGKYGV